MMLNVLWLFTKYFLSVTESRTQTGAVELYNIHQFNLPLFQPPPPFASILSMVTYITASNNYILSDMIFLSASYNMQCR